MKIGTDILDIDRIKKIRNLDAFLRKNFSDIEIEYVKSKKINPSTIAGIFCAKEAVLKAMELGIFDFPLRDIVIDHRPTQAPFISLNPQLLEKMQERGYQQIEISISHSDAQAIATCILF